MKPAIYFVILLSSLSVQALSIRRYDPWNDLNLETSTAVAALPPSLAAEMAALPRKIQGKPTEFFSEVAWSENAEKVMIWAPRMNFKDRAKTSYIIESMTFQNLKDGGLLFCKGCAAATERGNKSDPHTQNFVDSIKTCNWTLSEMVLESYKKFDIVSIGIGARSFDDLRLIVTGLEPTLALLRQNVAPALDRTHEQVRELYDHIICKFLENSLPKTNKIVPLGRNQPEPDLTMPANIQKLKKNVETWSQNQAVLNSLVSLKKKYNGKLPDSLLTRMSDIQNEVPVKFKKAQKPIDFEILEIRFKSRPELGFKTAADYENAALRFSESKSSSAMIRYANKTNLWIKYDPATKEALRMNIDGRLSIYNKTDRLTDNEALEQFLKDDGNDL